MAGPRDFLASNVSPPRTGGTQNVEATDSSGTTPVALEEAVRKRYVWVQCISDTDTDAVAFLFGGDDVEVDFATKHAPELKAGESAQFMLERGDTHVAVEASSGATPDFRITAVSPSLMG